MVPVWPPPLPPAQSPRGLFASALISPHLLLALPHAVPFCGDTHPILLPPLILSQVITCVYMVSHFSCV